MKTVFDNGRICVRVNPTGEVFVMNKKRSIVYPVEIRVGDVENDLIVTAHGALMTPTSKNGLDAFRVWQR